MVTDPFSNQAIEAQIKVDVARIRAGWLEWNAEAADGSLDEKIVETLVATLNAHARGYIRAVDRTPQISEYLSRLRQVGNLLIRHEREHGFLSDPYREARLRQIAESSGKLIEVKLSGPPEAYAAALESEIERTRIEFREKAEQHLHWRNSMFLRIDTHFEALYRYWEAESIAQVQRGQLSNHTGDKKPRGRPQTLSDEKKTGAARLKASGGTNKDAAALIYGTNYPTAQQTKNVPAILRHHQQKQASASSQPRKGSPKPRKTKG